MGAVSRRIEDLETVTLGLAQKFLAACAEAGHPVILTHTLRTMEEQAKDYAQGRSLPGKVITNAQAGQSPHNYGMAFDFAMAGPVAYPLDAPWEKLGQIGESLGMVWGGRWVHLKDLDHLERSDWKMASKGDTG